ncbi:hypothetical protein SDC9_177660 [bioreactor metagenome]|uniref:Uncharacterized protein n=1 Tax=bioreactor metagenome TaxID=1076179 RepID=A0A645GTQ7_9ZZZZ
MRLVGRQTPRRHQRVVVDPAGDDGIVWIAVQEVNNHLLPNAWNIHAAVAQTRRILRHANPDARVRVKLAIAIPIELHLHATIFVGVDFFAWRPRHDGGLRAAGLGFWGDLLAAIGNRLRHHIK